MDDLSVQLHFKRLVTKNISPNIHLRLWHNAQITYSWITLGTQSTFESPVRSVVTDFPSSNELFISLSCQSSQKYTFQCYTKGLEK